MSDSKVCEGARDVDTPGDPRPRDLPWAFVACASAIHLAPMPDAHDMNDKHSINHFVGDSVVPDANAVNAVLT